MNPDQLTRQLATVDLETLPAHQLHRFLSAITTRWPLEDLYPLTEPDPDDWLASILAQDRYEPARPRHPQNPHTDPEAVIEALEATDAGEWQAWHLRRLAHTLNEWADLDAAQHFARLASP